MKLDKLVLQQNQDDLKFTIRVHNISTFINKMASVL
jgi:hypothetical protein